MKGKFERELQELVNQHQESMDLGAFWNSVESDLIQQKKRKRILLILMSLGAVFLAFFLFLLVHERAPSPSLEENNAVLVDNNKTHINTTVISESEPKPADREISSKTVVANSNSIAADTPRSVLESKSVKKVENRNQFKNLQDSKTVVVKEIKETSKLLGNSNLSNSMEIKNTLNNGISSPKEFAVASSASIERGLMSESLLTGIPFRPFSSLETTMETLDTRLEMIALPAIKSQNKTITKVSVLGELTVSSVASFGRKSFHSSSNDSYSTMRENSEFVNEILDLTLETSIIEYQGFAFSSGIGFRQYAERFDWQGQYIMNKEVEYVDYILHRLDNTTTEHKTVGPVPHLFHEYFKLHESRYALFVPVELSYEIQKGKWALRPNFRVLASYDFSHSKTFLNEAGVPVNKAISSKVNLNSYILGTAVKYDLGSNYSILLGYQFETKQNRAGINDPNSMKVRYQLHGIRLSAIRKLRN